MTCTCEPAVNSVDSECPVHGRKMCAWCSNDEAGESGFCSGPCFNAWWLEQSDLAEYEHAMDI